MLPSKPQDCNKGILEREAFEQFLLRYDLLSELAAQLDTSGSSDPSSRDAITNELVDSLWAVLSQRAFGATPPGPSSPRPSSQEQEEVRALSARARAMRAR